MKTVTMDQIAARVSSRLRQNIGEVRSLLNSSFEIIREEVVEGNRVVLPKLITLDKSMSGMDLEGADSSEDSQTAELSHIILVVPSQDFFTNVIKQQLIGENREVSVTVGLDEARSVLAEKATNLIILDASIENFEDFIAEVKRTRANAGISLIGLYNEDVDPDIIRGVRVLEDATIMEPFDLTDLVELSKTEIARATEEKNFFDHQVRMELPTAERCVEEANTIISEMLEQSDMNEERQATLSVAFKEALDNAARHGNRYQVSKLIKVVYLVDRQKMTITIQDEGDGFDTELYLSRSVDGDPVAVARERHEAGRVGGLGIMLMLKCVDNLEYNYAGNMIKLTRNIAE